MPSAILRVVDQVEHFPGRPGLTVVSLAALGDLPATSLVSARLDDGKPRYAPGDRTVLLEEGSTLPEWLLREMGFWDDAKGKGTLTGGRRNRLKGRTFKGDGFEMSSLGALYGDLTSRHVDADTCEVVGEGGVALPAKVGDDLAAALGIT